MTQTATGLFPASYTVTTGQFGAPTLQLHLLVNTPSRTITGAADVSNYSTQPPFKLHADASGTFSYLTVMGPGSRILITGQGYSHLPCTQHAVVVKFHLLVETDWRSGVGSFSYLENNEWRHVEHATVTLDSAFEPPYGPGPVIPEENAVSRPFVVMYGPAIQQAIAQNTPLSELKALAQQAQQQLDNLPGLQAGLEALQAEIRKLTP